LRGKINWKEQLRYTPSRIALLEISIALVHSILGKKSVGYVTVVLFDKMAEKFHTELKIGSELGIEGFLWSRTFNKKGIGKVTEIKVVAKKCFLINRQER